MPPTATTHDNRPTNGILTRAAAATTMLVAPLILSGTLTDQFVINVDGGMALASGAAITLSGGVLAENVLFNFPSTSASHAANIGAAAFSGNFIAPYLDEDPSK